MARLRHPHIVQVMDIGFEGDVDYIVMEYVPGGTLDDRLEQGGPMPASVAVGRMLDVLSALSAAHAAGIVHRDVKPANILLDATDRAMLADFGIAMIEGDETRRTRIGVAMGSMAYMPPEQRLDAANVTAHADIYAAGATLYHLVSGYSPMDLFLADPESPRWDGVDDALAAVLRKACAERPEDRFGSAFAFAEALGPWSERGERPFEVVATPVNRLPRGPVAYVPTRDSDATTPQGRRRWWPAAITLVVAAWGLGMILATMWWWAPVPGEPIAAGPVERELVDEVVVASEREPDAAPEPDVAVQSVAEPPNVEAPATPTGSADRPARVPPLGAWRMYNNGVLVSLELGGRPDAIAGTVTSTLGGRARTAPVQGEFDPASRRLVLREGPDGAEYDVVLDEGLAKGRGQLRHRGRLHTIVLSRP